MSRQSCNCAELYLSISLTRCTVCQAERQQGKMLHLRTVFTSPMQSMQLPTGGSVGRLCSAAGLLYAPARLAVLARSATLIRCPLLRFEL